MTVNGVTYTAGDGNLVDNGDGTWALLIPVALAEGSYNVTAIITDLAGNLSIDPSSGELLIDTTIPMTPTVTPLNTSDTTPMLVGTANAGPGETLTVEVNGVVYTAGDGNLTDNGDGTWTLTIPVALAEGTYEVIATVTDAAGNVSVDTGTNELVIDITDPVIPTVNSLISSTGTPVLSGNTSTVAGETLSVSVDGIVYNAGDGNLIDNGDGTWELAIPALSTIADGTYEVIATITDLAGNTSVDISALELIVDTVAPIVPSVTAQNTSNTTPTISGNATVALGETLTVLLDGVSYVAGDGNLIDNSDGTWDLNVPAILSDNTYSVTVTVTDAAGNASIDITTAELIVDTVAPALPTVTALNTSNTTPTVQGTAIVAPGEILTVMVNGVTYAAGDGSLADNGDGTWALSIPVPLADETYEVTSTVTDAAGNATNDVTAAELVIDTTAPTIPTVVSQNTSNITPLIVGTVVVLPGETLTVTVDGITYTAGDGNLIDNGDGTWALSIPTPLAEGTYHVTTTIIDAAGNLSTDTSINELVIDITNPVIPTVTSLITNTNTPVLSGTTSATPGETLSVTVDGATYSAGDGNLVVHGDGTWNLSVPAPNAIADGNYEIVATITDLAGNTSTDVSTLELTVDTVAPVIPTVTSQVTSDTTPIISGSATVASGEVLTVWIEGVTYTAGDGNLVDNGDGTWVLLISVPLAEGTYQVTTTITDAAGNASVDVTVDELIIDTTPPATPAVIAQITNSTSPTINGTATVASDETLTVTVDSTSYTAGDGFLVDNGDGTWALSIPVSLAEGAFDVTATVTDLAGNATSDITSGELIIDLTAPIAPGVTSLVTNNATPVIEGTATIATGDTLTVEVNSVIYTDGDGFLVDNGDGTWALSIPATDSLSENLYQVIATVTDTAGNSVNDPGTDDLLVDFTAPPAPGVTSQTTNNTTPLIEGTAILTTGDTLSVTVNGVTYTAGDGNLVDNGDGTWALLIPVALAEGSYDVTATITDLAGNLSIDPSSGELLIDTTIPMTPTVTPLNTSDTTPMLVGTANAGPGETLTVEVNGVVYTAGDGNLTDNGNGTWTLFIPVALAEGIYEVIATVTDAAGNISVDTGTNELVIDITDPVIPTVNSLISSTGTPVLSGTTSTVAGETLSVSVDGVVYNAGDGNLVDNGNGTWDLTIPALNSIADGTYEVIATITDLAGNTSVDISTLELIVDTVAPIVPSVTAQNTSNTTPTISGNATVAPGETLTVLLDGVSYVAGDGNLVDNSDGTWDLNVPTILSDNTYAVIVTVTDAAGNASIDITTAELIIDTVAPAIPTVTPLNTNNTTPTLHGTATVLLNEILTVMVNGVTYTQGDGNLVNNGDGTWALSIPVSLADGTYEVISTISDGAGNTTTDLTASELQIDSIAPVVPTVMSQITSSNTPIIEGSATVAPGETLTVTVGGITYTAGDGNLIDNGDGTWALSIPTALAEGSYDVIATVTDASGNTSTDTSVSELIIDTTNPGAPTVQAQNTKNTSPDIYGTAMVSAGETLTVSVNGTTFTAGDGNLVDHGDGTWTLSLPIALSEGTFNVTATVTDAAGNATSDSTVSELIIDLTAPAAPGVTNLATADATPIIEGTATLAPGEMLTVEVNGVTYSTSNGNLVVNGDGTWTLSIPTIDTLVENLYQVIATVTDIAGNSALDPGVDDLLIDFTTPTTPGVTSQTTSNYSPIIEGTATLAAGEVLRVTVNGITYTAGDGYLVDNGDGTWTLSISVPLPEGLYDVTATITDTAGNMSTDPGSGELLIDSTSPITPTVTPLTTNDTTPVIMGTATASPNETLSVTVNGITYVMGDGNLNDNGDGTWSLTPPVPLAEGIYDVTASVTDAAGNSNTDASYNELVIDLTNPAIPTVTPVVTNANPPTITGTAITIPGETLSVTVNGITYINGDGNLFDNGDGTWELIIPTANSIADGIYEVVATITDVAGNQSSDITANELIVDTIAPEPPSVTPQVTNNTTPVISGFANVGSGETLTVTIDGTTYTAGDGNLIDNGDGTWDLLLPNALTDNTYPITVSITDPAGNSSSNVISGELVIQTDAPVVPTVAALSTSNTTPSITGTATLAPGDVLTVTVNGVTYTAGDGHQVDNGDGTWTLNIPTDLPLGVYDIVATVFDSAGNSSVSESGQLSILAQTDFDGDGIPDSLDLDDDNDGIPDSTEGLLDTDNDGQPDYQDLDSDNDGIADIVEVGGVDLDNDYRVDNLIDNNNDGLSDELQLFPFELVDTDNDRIADFRDLDSDNDGLTDLFESGGLDSDHDGYIDGFNDLNNDGADDANQLTGASGHDTDGDGVVNRLDLDTDNDGIFDVVEAGDSDIDNDGVLDTMKDHDLDGIPDSVDADITNGPDNDGDGIDDRFDVSIMGDIDTDDDGIIDAFDPDANGDGFADALTNNLALGQALPDSNGNGESDLLEPNGFNEPTGVVYTGIQGYSGCSIGNTTAETTRIDILNLLLLLASIASLSRRSSRTIRYQCR